MSNPLSIVLFWARTAASSALNVFGVRLEEQPRYRVLAREGRAELREYEPYRVARTGARGTQETAQNASFNVLAGYIFGKNESRTAIRMTAPVLQKQAGERIAMTTPVLQKQQRDGWTMEFMLPSKLDSIPRPLDPRVEIEQVPAETVATIRFSGSYGEGRREQMERALRGWLARRGDVVPTGEARLAVYDPPFTLPFLRRTEIHIPVRLNERIEHQPVALGVAHGPAHRAPGT